jgi:hypothetical protein
MPRDISQLLTYSQGIAGDWAQKNPIANWLAPTVPVVTAKFNYKNYGSGNAFLAIDTRRSMGGSAARLTYTVLDATGVLAENSLETTIDDQERRENTESESQLEDIKAKDLTLTILNNDLKGLFAFMKSNVSVTGGVGVWNNTAANDPIAEIDAQRKVVLDATGVMLNRGFIDYTAWLLLKNNKQVLDRIKFTKLGAATLETVSILLASPMEFQIGGGALYTDVGGSTNNMFLFYSQDSPGQQDPSWIKTFVRNPNRFTDMRQYREDKIRSDVYYLDWQQLRVMTGAGIVSRIQAT